MNPTLSSAESSSVINTLKQSKQVNDFIYSESGALHVNHSLQITNVPVSSGTVGAQKTMSFSIPKNGFLQNMWLNLRLPAFDRQTDDDSEIDGEFPTGNNVDGYSRLGLLSLIDNIKLESSGRVLESLSKWQILQRLSDLPSAERTTAQLAYRMGMDPPDNEAYDAALFLPFFWYKQTAKYGLDTDFIENHRVVVTLTDCKAIWDTSATDYVAHVPTQATLLTEYRQVDDHVRQEIIQKNYSSGMLSKVVRLSREEAYTVDTPTSTSEREVTVDLRESDCITGIYLTVVCPSTSASAHATYAAAIKDNSPLEITNVELRFSGQTIMNVPGVWLQYYGRTYGRPSKDRGDGAEDRQTDYSQMKYVYRLSFDGLGADLSNVVALREISQARLIIKYKPAAANRQHHVHVGYESVSFMTVSAATGRVNLSISS